MRVGYSGYIISKKIWWTFLLFISIFVVFGVSASGETVSGNFGWSYRSEGMTIYAENKEENLSASVTLNPYGTLRENCTAVSVANQGLIKEENWLENTWIDDYYLLYEGITSAGTSYASLTPPVCEEPGTSVGGVYTVRLVLLSDPEDLSSVCLSTEKLSFYQASLAVNTDSIMAPPYPSLTLEDVPKLSADGYYQVGTAKELYYVARYCGSGANIEITNDIFYNKLYISESGQIYSADQTVYGWWPLGSESDPYTGIIRGNSHRIYGLYTGKGKKDTGLIAVGKGCSVRDLTLSDCAFNAYQWIGSGGMFVGTLLLTSDDGHEMIFSNLHVENSGLSSNTSGGIIGVVKTVESNDLCPGETLYFGMNTNTNRNYLTISDCTIDACITAPNIAGGVIGYLNGGTIVTVKNCVNTGAVNANGAAGGIIGRADGVWQRIYLSDCANTGNVTARTYSGGVVGAIVSAGAGNLTQERQKELYSLLYSAWKQYVPFYYRNDSSPRWYNDTKLAKCFSTGSQNGSVIGGVVGYVDIKREKEIFASACMVECGTLSGYPAEGVVETGSIKFSSLSERIGTRCYTLYSASDSCYRMGQHYPGFHYEVADTSCDKEGSINIKCLICGEDFEGPQITPEAHCHMGHGETCLLCNEEIPECTSHTWEYKVLGNAVVARCTKCRQEESAWIELPGDTKHNATEIDLYLCRATGKISLKKTSGWDKTFPLTRLVFTSPEGKTSYNVMPTEPEDFGTVYLQVYTGKVVTSVKAATEPVSISAKWHDWEYTASGATLHASCSSCGETASVTIDADGANAANRNAVRNGYKGYEYEIFTVNNWDGQKGIEDYYILYDGTSVADNYKTGKKCDAFRRPTDAGNYTARVALLTNPLKPETVYISTEAVPFYISSVPFSQCDRKYYSDAEINKIRLENVPSVNSEGYYQVGTREELVWAATCGVMDLKIDITADIIVNPITVNEETGDVLCGAYDVFVWIPFGCNRTSTGYTPNQWGFSGTIRGNGHTITGLYNVNNDENMGFVNYGKGCTITDLTLENCVFSGKTACGTFIGRYDTESVGYVLMTLSGLSSYHCRISAEKYAGGIIGMTYPPYGGNYPGADISLPDPSTYMSAEAIEEAKYSFFSLSESDLGKRNYFTIKNCISGSTITGEASGGIIGNIMYATVYTVENCTNFGTVTGVAAGGILGKCQNRWQKILIKGCSNAGKINGSTYLGGIVGFVDASDASRDRSAGQGFTDYWRLQVILSHRNCYKYNRVIFYNDTYVEDCVSIGPLGVGTYTGGILGYYDMRSYDYTWGSATMINCKYSQTRNAVGASNSAGFTFEAHGVSTVMAEQLPDSTKASYICESVLGGHLSEAQWEYESGLGCEQERTATLKCRLCEEILGTKTVSAHNHQFVLGACNFCGAEETNTASVFSGNLKLFLPMAGVAVVILATLFIYKKKAKKAQ